MDKIKLVIFDCDGVLIDSERIANIILLEILNEIGIFLTLEEVIDIFIGTSTNFCIEIIQNRFGKSPPENFATEFERRCIQAFITDLQPVQGIKDVLSTLKLAHCVASNSGRNWVGKALAKTDLLSYFSGKIFSAKEVTRSKPYPDVFLYAAEKMGFLPQECVVIEDTPTGVRAGVDAGMTKNGHTEMINPEKLREVGASVVFNDMKLLPNLLEQNQYFVNSAKSKRDI